MINVGTIFLFSVSIDEYGVTGIASDGYDRKPQKVKSLIINLGVRFDSLIKANQAVSNYWLRAESMEV